MHRALEIGAVLGRAIEAGHRLGFVTLTMRHDRSQSLAELFDAASKGWGRVTSGRAWVVDQSGTVEGWVRVWEVTYGENGWHVHVHLVLVLDVDATAADLDRVARGMFERWSRSLVGSGLRAPMLRGQDWHLVHGSNAAENVAGYLSKMVEGESAAAGLGLELTHTSSGRARSQLETRPVWSLLDDLVETGEARALRLWHEWEQGSKGKRQVGWSQGLRERFAPEVEDVDDQAVVDAEVGSADDDVLSLDVEGWRSLVADPGRIVLLLHAVEDGGFVSATSLLDWWGIPWEDARPGAAAAAGRGGDEGASRPDGAPGSGRRRAGGLDRSLTGVRSGTGFAAAGSGGDDAHYVDALTTARAGLPSAAASLGRRAERVASAFGRGAGLAPPTVSGVEVVSVRPSVSGDPLGPSSPATSSLSHLGPRVESSGDG